MRTEAPSSSSSTSPPPASPIRFRSDRGMTRRPDLSMVVLMACTLPRGWASKAFGGSSRSSDWHELGDDVADRNLAPSRSWSAPIAIFPPGSGASAVFVLGLRRAGGDVPDDVREQRVEGLSLRGCQTREDLVVDLTERAVDVGKQPLAGSREGDDRAPPVGAITAPLDQVCVFEAVEDRHQVGGVDAQQLHQRLLGGRTALAQVHERQHFVETQPGGRDCLFDAPPRSADELDDEQAAGGPDVGRGVDGGHRSDSTTSSICHIPMICDIPTTWQLQRSPGRTEPASPFRIRDRPTSISSSPPIGRGSNAWRRHSRRGGSRRRSPAARPRPASSPWPAFPRAPRSISPSRRPCASLVSQAKSMSPAATSRSGCDCAPLIARPRGAKCASWAPRRISCLGAPLPSPTTARSSWPQGPVASSVRTPTPPGGSSSWSATRRLCATSTRVSAACASTACPGNTRACRAWAIRAARSARPSSSTRNSPAETAAASMKCAWRAMSTRPSPPGSMYDNFNPSWRNSRRPILGGYQPGQPLALDEPCWSRARGSAPSSLTLAPSSGSWRATARHPDARTGPLRFGPPGHGSQRIDLDEALRPAQARHHEHRDCGGVRAPDLP